MVTAKKIEHHIKEFILPGTREADERILNDALDTFEQAGSTQTTRINSHFHNRVTKTVAAVVVIGVLIPLGYGASRIIRTLMLKPAGEAELSIDFKLNKDLSADLRVGTKQSPEIVQTSDIRFFVEDGQLRGLYGLISVIPGLSLSGVRVSSFWTTWTGVWRLLSMSMKTVV